jgi:hypothetical protein
MWDRHATLSLNLEFKILAVAFLQTNLTICLSTLTTWNNIDRRTLQVGV